MDENIYKSISMAMARGSMDEYNELSEEDKKKFHQIEAEKERSFYNKLRKQSHDETITITLDFSCIEKK